MDDVKGDGSSEVIPRGAMDAEERAALTAEEVDLFNRSHLVQVWAAPEGCALPASVRSALGSRWAQTVRWVLAESLTG